MWQRDELLAAFREERGPSPEAVERIAERLAKLGPAREPAKVIALVPSRRANRVTRIAVVVGAIAAALVLGWWIRGVTLTPVEQVHGSLADDHVDIAPKVGEARTVERVVEPRARDREAPAIAPAPAVEPSPTFEPTAPPEPPTVRERPHRRGSPTAGVATPSDPPPEAAHASDTLAAELAIVQRARAQLSRGQAREALATVAEHAEQFPRGKLGEEAAAVRTMAQCRLHPAEVERLRTAFVERHPKSLFRKQVEAACPSAGKGQGE